MKAKIICILQRKHTLVSLQSKAIHVLITMTIVLKMTGTVQTWLVIDSEGPHDSI